MSHIIQFNNAYTTGYTNIEYGGTTPSSSGSVWAVYGSGISLNSGVVTVDSTSANFISM